jgi:hypothetical protein
MPRVDPTEKGLNDLMQLAQSGIAPHDHSSPDMRAGPAQYDSKLICTNLLICLAHVAKNSSVSNHSESDFLRPPVFLVILRRRLEL